jgi:hypothetical protein
MLRLSEANHMGAIAAAEWGMAESEAEHLKQIHETASEE